MSKRGYQPTIGYLNALLNGLNSKLTEKPQTLCHYTTAKGLQGIIQSNCLWATHYQYLNDKVEFSYGREIVEKTLEKLSVGSLSNAKEYIARAQHLLGKKLFQNPYGSYVVSLSDAPDQLSQWRGYSDDGQGYMVEFDTTGLIPLGKVFYTKNEQNEIAQKTLQSYIDILEDADVENFTDNQKTNLKRFLFVLIQQIAAHCKNESFREEQEWRIWRPVTEVSQTNPTFDKPNYFYLQDIQFRDNSGMLIPYIEIPFLTETPPIKRIIIGPRHNFIRAKTAIMLLLEKEQRRNKAFHENLVPLIEESKIPYA